LSYLTANPQPGTYSNTNVAAYLTGNITTGNISATQYNFANGVNILTTVVFPTQSTLVNGSQTLSLEANGLLIVPDGLSFNNGSTLLSGSLNAGAGGSAVLSTYDGWNQVFTQDYDAGAGAGVWVQTSADGNTYYNWQFKTNGNLSGGGNVLAAGYYFANGVNILNTVAGTYSNANAAAYMSSFYTYANATYSTIANAASQQTAINNLSANAASQQIQIDSINANVAAANVAWLANAASQATTINSLQGNANKLVNGSYQFVLDSQGVLNVPISQYNTGQIFAPINYSLFLGTSSKFIQIRGSDGAIIFADYTAQTTAYPGPSLLNGVNANIAAANSRIITLEGNVGAYETWANTTFSTVANATSQQIQIDNFNANLGAYQTYANGNATTQATGINNINANLGAFQTYANATFSTVANATSQQLQINSLQANIAAANTLIYSNANVAAYLLTATINTTGNITGGNLTIANNAVILGNLRVAGTQTTVNTSTLNVTDLYITVANAATQPSDANGAGLRVAGALANITYVYPGDYWEFNKPIHANLTTGNIVFGDGTYQTTSWYANAASQQIQIDNIDPNLGTLTTNVTGLDANIGAFQTYANSTFVTGTPWTSAGYLTAEADTLDSVTTRGNTTTNNITVGVITNTTGLKIQPDQYGENIDATGSSTPGSLLLKGKSLYLTGDAGAGPFAQAVLGPSTGMNVYLSDGFNNSTWQFANDGTFNLPNTVPGIGAVVQSTEAINIISNGHTVKLNTNGELIIENTIRTQAGQYYLAASDTSVEMSWTNATVAPSTTVYSGFNASAAGAYVTVANTDPTNNWVTKDWLFGMDGNLTVPGDIIPNVDNLHDLGSATNRFRHLYVGPGTIYVGNAAISTTATGNLLIPGLTRAIASSAYVEEVQDTGNQTYSFGTVPTVIDGAYWQQLTSGSNFSSFTPAEYSVDQLDGEGFIDGISIDSAGSGYAGEIVRYANQSMWATEVANPLQSFVRNQWVEIPFRVQTRAGESEYEFNFGGGGSVTSSDTPPNEPEDGALWYDQVSGRLFVWYDDTWVDASIGGGGGDSSYSDANVAAYLLANPESGTYSNVNVAAYVDGGITISSGPINFTASPPAYSLPGISWTNGFQSRMYGNTEVAAYLVENPQGSTYSNSNVAAYLLENPQGSTYSNSNVAVYLTENNYITTADLTGYATETYVGTAINNLINSAPGTLDTLGEIAANLAAEANAIGAILNSITNTNNNVAAISANVIQNDWNQSDSANIAYIKNKPDLTVYSTVANAAAQAVWLSNLQSNVQTISANLGAYQTWANSTFATASSLSGYATTTQFNTLNANVGAYQIYANANLGTATTNISTLQANVGAYQIWANANAATQATSISTLQTQVYSNANVIANLQNLTTNITTTGNISGNTAGFTIGYLDIPQNATNSNYVLALADRGRHVYSTTSSNQTVYIPTNANAAFPIGSAVNFVLQGTGNIIITANSGVTLFLAGNSTSGANSRTLTSYGVATVQKVATNTWFAVGVGLA
jgi:hypothetical protein